MNRWPALLAALAAVVAVSGCGSAKDAQRHDFNGYVAQVNRLENQASRAWVRARLTYVQLGKGVPSAQEVRRLAAVPGTIRGLRRDISRIQAPADAKPIQRMLLHLLSLDTELAGELASFGRYVHDVSGLERELGKATTGLRRSLKATKTRGPQEQALAGFSDRLGTIVTRLRALAPPPAMAPWQHEQVARVVALRAGAEEVRRGLERNDRAAVGEGLGVLEGAVAQSSVTKADRAAIVAYNSRLARIGRLLRTLNRRQAEIAHSLS